MIRLRGWRPAHGWAPFLTELVVVVLGVLIALGAQQAVDSWTTARKLDELRQALKVEIADNLGSYNSRVAQSDCLARRLDQLEAWQADWRDGEGPALVGTIGRPLAYRSGLTVWDTGAADLADSLPLEERLAYADLYAGFKNYLTLAEREVAAWQALYAYDNAQRLSPAEVNALRGFILAARSTDRSIGMNFPRLQELAAANFEIAIPSDVAPVDPSFCTPLRLSE